MKKRKIILKDHELFFIFQWVQRLFVFTTYVSICYIFFFVVSVIVPFLYLYVFDLNFNIPLSTKLIYYSYFRDIKYFYLILNYFFDYNFVFFTFYFVTLSFKFLFLFYESFIYSSLLSLLLTLLYLITYLLIYLLILPLAFLKLYIFPFFKFFKGFLTLALFLKNFFIDLLSFNHIVDVFKTFLFSDNFFIFLS